MEIEIKDLVRMQQNTVQINENYHDIFSSTYMPRENQRFRISSVSSSSTLNNLMSLNSAHDQPEIVSTQEKKEETITETVETRRIQSNFQQTGENFEKSAFSIPMQPSTTAYQVYQSHERQIHMPELTSISSSKGDI